MQFFWNVRLISQKHIGIKSSFYLVLMATILFSTLSIASTVDEVAQLRQIAQLAEYVGVDYASAVDNGQVINDDEYQEMLEFSELIIEKTSINNNDMRSLNEKASALQTAISTKQNVNTVRQLSSELRISLLAMMPESLLPKRLLSKEATVSLDSNQLCELPRCFWSRKWYFSIGIRACSYRFYR